MTAHVTGRGHGVISIRVGRILLYLEDRQALDSLAGRVPGSRGLRRRGLRASAATARIQAQGVGRWSRWGLRSWAEPQRAGHPLTTVTSADRGAAATITATVGLRLAAAALHRGLGVLPGRLVGRVMGGTLPIAAQSYPASASGLPTLPGVRQFFVDGVLR